MGNKTVRCEFCKRVIGANRHNLHVNTYGHGFGLVGKFYCSHGCKACHDWQVAIDSGAQGGPGPDAWVEYQAAVKRLGMLVKFPKVNDVRLLLSTKWMAADDRVCVVDDIDTPVAHPDDRCVTCGRMLADGMGVNGATYYRKGGKHCLHKFCCKRCRTVYAWKMSGSSKVFVPDCYKEMQKAIDGVPAMLVEAVKQAVSAMWVRILDPLAEQAARASCGVCAICGRTVAGVTAHWVRGRYFCCHGCVNVFRWKYRDGTIGAQAPEEWKQMVKASAGLPRGIRMAVRQAVSLPWLLAELKGSE